MAKVQIKHKATSKILFESEIEACEKDLIKVALEMAVLLGADLRGADVRRSFLKGACLEGANLGAADFGGADLEEANFGDADLEAADFRNTNLRGSSFRGTNLRGAKFEGADFEGASLRDIKVPPNDHRFISEILWRAAKTEPQRDLAARVRVETRQCWGYFYVLARKKGVLEWVRQALEQWEEYKIQLDDLEDFNAGLIEEQ
jgi:uncharacterized protein YjbI with pentapeptide repeats